MIISKEFKFTSYNNEITLSNANDVDSEDFEWNFRAGETF